MVMRKPQQYQTKPKNEKFIKFSIYLIHWELKILTFQSKLSILDSLSSKTPKKINYFYFITSRIIHVLPYGLLVIFFTYLGLFICAFRESKNTFCKNFQRKYLKLFLCCLFVLFR